MNFDNEFFLLKQEIKNNTKKLVELAKEYKEHRQFTAKFLLSCKKYKIDKVLIEGNSVKGKGKNRINNWPAIWTVVEELGISGGSGNSDQHYVKREAKLVDGLYKLKDGLWERAE